MPSVWSEHFTKEGRVYYYNKSSKQSSWEKPADFDGSSESSAVAAGAPASSSASGKSSEAAAAASSSTAAEWEELWDPKNERAYYYNRTLRKTQWAKPEGVEIKPYAGAARKEKATTKSSTAATASNGSDETKTQTAATAAASSNTVAAANGGTTASPKKKTEKETNGHAQKHHHHHHSTTESATAADEDSKTAVVVAATAKTSAKSPTKKRLTSKESADLEQETERPRRSSVSGADAAGDGEEPQHKKRKKKAKREKSENANASVSTSATSVGLADRKKTTPRRESDKRMIIWDDEDQQQRQTAREPIPEKDTEDGKEATRLLQEMAKPDAIMEVNVLNVINGFLRAHNESDGPEILVEKLSSSYRGYAQMIGLVTSWLDAVPMTRSALDHKVIFDVAEGSVVEHKGPSWEPADEILYDHLKEIVMQHYEPKLLSDVLSASAAEPEWLTQMVDDRKWRVMLIELAETHKTCNLLQYAIRRISAAGYHKEIASISNANSIFSVFNGVLLDACCRIPFATEEDVREDLTALSKICCQSAYSYLYAEELLCAMDNKLYLLQKSMDSSSKQQYAHYRMVRSKLSRVRFELHETAFNKFGAKIETCHPLRRRYIYDANPRLSEAILSIIKTRRCSEPAAEALVKEYKGSKHAPPVAHIRDPAVLHCLLDPLFNSSQPISTGFSQNCIALVAYAACAKDDRSILQIAISKSERIEVDEDEVEKTKQALRDASSICRSDNTLGYNMTQSGVVEKLVSVMAIPVVSMGILHWLEVILQDAAFVNSTLLHICFPSLLRILKASIKLHSAQWPIAFRVLVRSLRLHPDINPVKALELKRESLRSMVFMITSGYVLPVLEFVVTNTAELDQALLRNFITALFARIAPPYSTKFVLALTRILTHPKVQNAITSCPPDCKLKLKAFVSYCTKNAAMLSSDQLQALVFSQEA